MQKISDLGPKEWTEDFYSRVISRIDENNHPKVTQRMVDEWVTGLDSAGPSIAEHFKSAIEVAKHS
jgi:hypothetical protein